MHKENGSSIGRLVHLPPFRIPAAGRAVPDIVVVKGGQGAGLLTYLTAKDSHLVLTPAYLLYEQ
jgi:hypothetical protein